jgi:hypothetical protein
VTKVSRVHIAWLSIVAAALLAGCAASPFETDEPAARDEQAREYLDEATGATISAVDRPLVFARDRSERAANQRDYVTLVAATVNRGGARTYVLIAYIWSTLDPRYEPAHIDPESLVIVGDDRRIRLNANGKSSADLGVARGIDAPQGRAAKPLAFPIDPDTLRFIAAARTLEVQAKADDAVVSYILWDDQRHALDKFVRFLDGVPR